MLWPGRAMAAGAVLGLVAAVALDRASPPPSAEVAAGSEEAFASGLEPRELVPRSLPQRWTSPESRFRFRNLPPGPARLEVALHAQRTPVALVVDGVIVGTLAPGTSAAEVPLTAGRALDVTLRPDGLWAGRRRLAPLLDRVRVTPAAAGWPAPGLVIALIVTGVGVAASAAACGFSARMAVVWSAAASAGQALTLLPWGVARSG